MTLRDLLDWFGQYPLALAGIFLIPPLLVGIAGFAHGRGNGGESPWRYLYAVLIYLVSVPGMAAAVLTAYALIFASENLTLGLTSRNVDFDEVPGFDRLLGLMVALAITFIVVLGISKTRIWLFFGSSIFTLMLLVAVLIAIFVWGGRLAFGGRRD
jgi:hypothetical protein